jgi:signal transduction histidine kinase
MFNSPNTKLSFDNIDLLKVLKSVIDQNKLLFEENKIEVQNNITDVIIINEDIRRISEIFINIFNNSVKFSNEAGTIIIDAKQNKDFIFISIKDDGIGMSEEQLNHVFDEFYKADGSRHDFDSSGLGLPICKRIVEKHGGEIWAESEGIGKGSPIYITLPRMMKVENYNI